MTWKAEVQRWKFVLFVQWSVRQLQRRRVVSDQRDRRVAVLRLLLLLLEYL